MGKTPQIFSDFGQSDAKCLEHPRKDIDEKTTEHPEDIEETWVEVERKTRTQSEEVRKNRQLIQIFVSGRVKNVPLLISP